MSVGRKEFRPERTTGHPAVEETWRDGLLWLLLIIASPALMVWHYFKNIRPSRP